VAKQRNGFGRKVKMSQPIAISWDLYITLAGAKVVKGPVVPKMEVMEKWIVSGGRDIEIHKDRETGTVIATLVAPGSDGPTAFGGQGDTIPLAVANAIGCYIKAQPEPDPSGGDLPLFRRDSPVADDATDDEGSTATDSPAEPDAKPKRGRPRKTAVEQTLNGAGIPVKQGDDGLYRNPNGDAYPEGWAETEAGIVTRNAGK
jgi:hypothetical protein